MFDWETWARSDVLDIKEGNLIFNYNFSSCQLSQINKRYSWWKLLINCFSPFLNKQKSFKNNKQISFLVNWKLRKMKNTRFSLPLHVFFLLTTRSSNWKHCQKLLLSTFIIHTVYFNWHENCSSYLFFLMKIIALFYCS